MLLNYFCVPRCEIQTESGHEAVTVCQEGRGPGAGEGRRGERAAAGWLVVVWIVEVDTDGPLGGRSPDTGPAPLGCSIGEGDAQIILNTAQLYYRLEGAKVLTLLQPPSPMSWLSPVTWLKKIALWLL